MEANVFLLILVPVFILLLTRKYLRLKINFYEGNEDLIGKTVVVTGANSAIGLEAARDFARRRARLIMVCRDTFKAEKARFDIIRDTNNENITIKHVDFLSLDSVRRCAREILEEESRIDVLVNNAGAMMIGFGKSGDGLEKLMQNNYFGPFLFTNLLLGRIKASAPSRIVNVSSLIHKMGKIDLASMKNSKRWIDLWLYSDTKLAIICATNELARKLHGTGVTVNSLNPGIFKSDILRHANPIMAIFKAILIRLFFQTVKEAAQTTIYLSVATEVAGVTGKYFSNCQISQTSSIAENREILKDLWKFSEETVKLKSSEKFY